MMDLLDLKNVVYVTWPFGSGVFLWDLVEVELIIGE